MIGYIIKKPDKNYFLAIPFNMRAIGNKNFMRLYHSPSDLENMSLSMILRKNERRKFIENGNISCLNISDEKLNQFREFCFNGDDSDSWFLAFDIFNKAIDDFEYYHHINGFKKYYLEKEDWWKNEKDLDYNDEDLGDVSEWE